MIAGLTMVADCMRHAHDGRLVATAGIVCAIGIYASFALAQHAARSTGKLRTNWGLVSIVASGCTAWATHFIVLLAFKPGMPAAFEPVLTAASLLAAIGGIGAGITLSLRSRRRPLRQFGAGIVVGAGIATLHYVGQTAYVVAGTVQWDLWLVVPSIIVSLPLAGVAIMAVSHGDRRIRRAGPALLLLSISILHFCGMAAMMLHPSGAATLPDNLISPGAITPVVAGISCGLIILAVLGWRFDLTAKARVRQDQRRLRELADVALEGLLICCDGMVTTANNSIERLSGHRGGVLTGQPVAALFPGVDIAGLPQREEREADLIGAGGQVVPVRVLRSEIMLGHKCQTVIAVRDQRERLRTEAEIRALAFNDHLTELPNRTRFFDLLAAHATGGGIDRRNFAVFMLDLDRFKQVNDTSGHAAGDRVLRMVADRLSLAVGDDAVVARLGGDEFAILESKTSIAAASGLAAQLIAAIESNPFPLDGQSIYLGTSIGLAFAPEDGTDPTELLRNADLALYAAKAQGRGVFCRYDVSLDDQMRERRALEEGLREALANGELELAYQPLVEAETGCISGAEALVRWRHPIRGYIPPSSFIPVAEESGLILPLGLWVLETACAAARTWPEDVRIAVNLSPVQFRDRSLVEHVAAALARSGLAPNRLELEITEGVLLSDEARTLDTLNDLRRRGVRISMDDFGTGYSSLSYLCKFPFDKIKIDQSFTRRVPDHAESVAIVRAILTMSSRLGISTTVEGVETLEQLEFSVAEGCDTIQGFLVSRPIDGPTFAEFVSGNATRHTVSEVA